MFNFNLKESAIFQAVKWSKAPLFKYAQFLKKLFLLLFIITFLIFLYGFFGGSFTQDFNRKLLGAAIILLVLYVVVCLKDSFFNSRLKKPRLRPSGYSGQAKLIDEAVKTPEKYNLAEFLSFEISKAANSAVKFAKLKKIPEINSNILFYFLLRDNPRLNFVFSRVLLDSKQILEEVRGNLDAQVKSSKSRFGQKFPITFTKDFQDFILESLKIAQKKGHKRIEIGDAIAALSRYNPIFINVLIQSNSKTQDIESLVQWLENFERKIGDSKKFWDYKNLAKRGTFAKGWAAGFTVTLDKYSVDWTDFIKKRGFEEMIGHKSEIEKIERILSRTEINNVLLAGEPGTGRGAIIQSIAQRSLFGESLPALNHKRVVELDMPTLISQIESAEEFEATLDQIFRETIAAGNIILVINEFHNYVNQLARPGIIDISGALLPYLKSPKFQIIAITTFEGLHRQIEKDSSLLSLFEKVEVSEISDTETITLLENQALVLEQKYKKLISYPALRDIVNYSRKYLPAVSFPKKAIDLLDEIMVYLAGNPKDEILLPDHIAKIIFEKTKIPVGELHSREKELLLNLETLIHQRIINQDEAVDNVSDAMRRARVEVTIRSGPIGCFLFLGPTGVGKTETSKALAEIYFGSEARMIRLDMSEFQNLQDIPRLIGSTGEEGLLTTKVRENPFSLVLLDEVEKAHPNILNLFLQVLDEGHLTDGFGRKVDFKNVIIIATSNAGAEIIWEDIKLDKKLNIIKDELLDYLIQKGIFRPEFINRFNSVVVFNPLTKESLLQIAELLFQKLKTNLAEKGIEFVITEPLKEKIVELGYNPVFGAREMRRVIQDKVENVLAASILSGKIKRGDKIEINPAKFKVAVVLNLRSKLQ